MKGNRRNVPVPAIAAAPMTAATGSSPPSPSPPPTSSMAKGTAKYTNKDGSKFITVPKPSTTEPRPPLQNPPSATSAATGSTTKGPLSTPASTADSVPTGNRKKAKRRAKAAAAREKAGQQEESSKTQANGMSVSSFASSSRASEEPHAVPSDDDAGESADEGGADLSRRNLSDADGQPARTDANKAKKSKKKKKKKDESAAIGDNGTGSITTASALQTNRSYSMASKQEKIWNTNSQEERRRIKEFWLHLSEEERKSLVKVEKDTVLKKMKEQQKVTCSCHVCGRKRTAIEEELEGLYDSYYEELEQFANDPAGQNGRAPALMLGTSSQMGSSTGLRSPAPAPAYAGQQPSRDRILSHAGADESGVVEDEYGDDDDGVADDDDSESDEEDIPQDELTRDYTSDFFSFGNSLQVHGGILTVADDLLKNDGRKFIEMMEQLAERRMAREEDAKDPYRSRGGAFPQNGADGPYGHNHHPLSEEDSYGPEDDEDYGYNSQDEESDEGEDTMTEEQRMEEGRRMFQIFAARMFEQRVLTAYREKVAKERQQKLLEELANEETQESQRKAKKAKEAQKRKDKAAQKKQALAEEKSRKDAEKAAEEEARRKAEAEKAEEHRQKMEEKRKKREAQRKAEDDERLRKEAERQRRINDQKEKQAEQERRTREAKEREKKIKDEARLRERETQEKKERESRERKEMQERERRDREAGARANDNRDHSRQDERTTQKAPLLPAVPVVPSSAAPSTGTPSAAAAATLALGASIPTAAPVPITLPKRQHQQVQAQVQTHHQPALSYAVPALPKQAVQPTGFTPPQIPLATPALPLAPSPMRARQSSQHGGSTGGNQSAAASRTASLSGSGQSQSASPNLANLAHASPGSFTGNKVTPTFGSLNQSAASHNQASFQATSPLSTASAKPAMPQQASPLSVAPTALGVHHALGIAPSPMSPGLGLASQYTSAMSAGPLRSAGPPPMVAMGTGINGMGRNFGAMMPPPGFGHHVSAELLGSPGVPVVPLSAEKTGMHIAHSRQPSGGFDGGSSPIPPTLPISRPAPIGRPGSVVHGQQHRARSPMNAAPGDMDADNSYHLGSKALLDDSDLALNDFSARRPPGPGLSTFAGPASPFGFDLSSPFVAPSLLWGGMSQHPIPNSFNSGPPPGFAVGSGVTPGGWGAPVNTVPFPSHGSLGRSSQARSMTLRQILCRVCRELSDANGDFTSTETAPNNSFIPIEPVKSRVNLLAQHYIDPVRDSELDVIYETEGNSNNGGGNFDVQRNSENAVTAIRWLPDTSPQQLGSVGGEAAKPPVGGPGEGSSGPIGAAFTH